MQRIGETQVENFRRTLKNIRLGKGRARAKIAQLESLKSLLLMTLKTESKRKEMRQIEPEEKVNQTRADSTQYSEVREQSLSEMCRSVNRIDESAMCRKIVQGICKSYDERHNLNIKLYDLQCENQKQSSKYQKYLRANDYQNQVYIVKTLLNINNKISHMNSLFCRLKHSIIIQHDNLRDFIKVMKIRYALAKKKGRQERQKSKAVAYLEGQKKITKRIESGNQNRNQFLINTGR